MGVKSSVRTFTIQVNFDILILKNKKWSDFLQMFGVSFVFLMGFEGCQDHIQIKQNFRNLLFIYRAF